MDYEQANEAVTGAPGPLALGGSTYLVSPPTDQDFTTLRVYLRERLANPLQAIAADLDTIPPQYREAAIKAAVELKAGGGVGVTAAHVEQELMKPDGCAFWAWLLIRKNHPSARLEDIKPLVTKDNVVDVLAGLYRATGMEAIAGKVAGPA